MTAGRGRQTSTASRPLRTATDNLDALMAELSVSEIMTLIERTTRWVDPATFRRLPVWYLEHSRSGLFYKANWSKPQLNRDRQTDKSVHKREATSTPTRR